MSRETRHTSGKQSQRLDLHRTTVPGLYFLVLDFARACWPDLQLTSDQEPEPYGYTFLYDKVAETLPFVYRNGIRFGSATAKHTEADKFAFITFGDTRVPCKIEYLLRIRVADWEPQMCAIVAQMMADQHIPIMPWDQLYVLSYLSYIDLTVFFLLNAVELGTFTAYADQFASFCVVPIEGVVAPTALCKLQARSTLPPRNTIKLWIAILYDRVHYFYLI